AGRDDVDAGFEEAADLVHDIDVRHVEHAIGLERDHIVEAVGGLDADRRHTSELAGIAADLVRIADPHASEIEARMLNDPTQCARADIAGAPLHDAVAAAAAG